MRKICLILFLVFVLNIYPCFARETVVASFEFTGGVSQSGGTVSCGEATIDSYGAKLEACSATTNAVGNKSYTRTPEKSYLKFNIGAEQYGTYEVSVDYKRYKNGMFKLTYTDVSGEKRTAGTLYIEGNPSEEPGLNMNKDNLSQAVSGTKIFLLENADFSREVDFEINSVTDEEDNKHGFSTVPVYIERVNVSKSPDRHNIQPYIRTEKTGNIFFDGEIPVFHINYCEKENKTTEFKAEYKVVKIEKDRSETEIKKGSNTFLVNAGGETEDTLQINVPEYGIYKLYVAITNDAGLNVCREVEFSKAVRCTEVNKSFGTNIHPSTAGLDEKYMKLTKDAGIGVVRSSIEWAKYEEQKTKKYALNKDAVNFLSLSKKYGLEPMVIISNENSHYAVTDTDSRGSGLALIAEEDYLENFKDYVTALLSEPLMHNVDKIEITNEPNGKAFYYNGQVVAKPYTNTSIYENLDYARQSGEVYAKISEAAAEAVRVSNKPDVKLGILSLAQMRYYANGSATKSGEFTRVFTDTVLKTLKNNNALNYFNSVTYHPYSYWSAPEIGASEQKDVFDGVAENYSNALTNEVWHTEFGYSTSKHIENVACIADDYEQAKLIVRQFGAMKSANPSDLLIQYDMVDDGVRTNTQEANYGILTSDRDDIPLQAKFSYLAISNMNKLIGDATQFSQIKNTVSDDGLSGDMVCKFSNGTRDVYMLWSLGGGSYPAIDGAIYYDMLGNKTEVSGDSISLCDEPIYAVCGEAVNRSEIQQAQGYEVDVKGNIETMEEGVPVSVIVTGNTDLDTYGVGDIIYMDEGITGAKGSFRFKTYVTSDAGLLNIYVSAKGCIPQNFVTTAKETDIKVTLCKGLSETGAFLIDVHNLDDVSVIADTKNNVYDELPVMLYALYKDEALVNVVSAEVVRNDNGMSFEYSLRPPVNIEYDRAGVFIMKSETSLMPLCSAVKID